VRIASLLLALWPSLAVAQTETATIADAYTMPAEGARTIEWYGWETLSFDATFGVALLASAAVLAHQKQSDAWIAPIGLPYLIATPIVHGLHESVAAALISAGIRLIVPAATFAIIRATCDGTFCRESSTAHQAGLWTGFTISLFIAPLIDAALFAWEER
jgi:hypothetical protein